MIRRLVLAMVCALSVQIGASAASLESRNALGELSSAQVGQALVNLGLGASSASPSNLSALFFGTPTPNNYVMTGGGPAFQYFHPLLSGTPSSRAYGAQYQIKDEMTSPSIQDWGVWIDHDVAPGGSTASGSRVALEVDLNEWGTATGGTYTNLTDSTATRSNITMNSNRGGTSTNYAGQGFGMNATCIAGAATFVSGCVGMEIDYSSNSTGFSYAQNTGLQIVQNGTTSAVGLLNDNVALGIYADPGLTAGLAKYGLLFGAPNSGYPLDPYGIAISVGPAGPAAGNAPIAGAFSDSAQLTVHNYVTRTPFQKTIPIYATGVAAATRLTSDGSAANSYIQNAYIGIKGSSYTSNPTVTITGCPGAVVNAQLSGAIVGRAGVYNPGSGCSSDATASLSGGGGSGTATIALEMGGNTLNFPHATVVDVKCTVVARNGSQAIGWSTSFGAEQNGTASTTATVGTPAWTTDFENTVNIGISAPTADTTLGAINITITPTSGTWTVGGTCVMTGTSQVL